GAGKSTIIKMIAGLIVPTSGKITIDGTEVAGVRPAIYKKLSAVLEGTRNVYWRMTPLENLYYFANLRGVSTSDVKDRVERLLKDMEIDGKKRNQSQHLSRGMLQKLALAAALITDPKVILLDEPTLGLDVGSARKIKEMVRKLAREEGRTILLTTHQMDLVEDLADRVGIIRQGSLAVEGRLSELQAIFKSHIYRLRVKGRFAPPAAWKKYDVKVLPGPPEYTEMELDCGSNAGVYDVLAVVKTKKLEIASMTRVVEDLEEIFLRVLSSADAAEGA
ncbi:MAG: ABC transporter ATP-binding protein, partial [Spirochaetia bacterium]|nr:ABC transporter ATP-binding protein [Spirochaetia bacterium]